MKIELQPETKNPVGDPKITWRSRDLTRLGKLAKRSSRRLSNKKAEGGRVERGTR